MGATAELRWFFEGSAPPALTVWFHSAQRHGWVAGGGQTSTDAYFIEPGNPRVGTKRRGGRPGLELKLLVDVLPQGCEQAPFEGRVELWVKQHVTLLHTNGMLPVEVVKRRWLRWFDCSGGVVQEVPLGADEKMPGEEATQAPGCQAELAELELAPGVRWMTLAFEASGPVDLLVDSLRRTAAALVDRSPPALDGPVEASYPAWLPRAVT